MNLKIPKESINMNTNIYSWKSLVEFNRWNKVLYTKDELLSRCLSLYMCDLLRFKVKPECRLIGILSLKFEPEMNLVF
jgi:hypothetical protein